MMPNDRRPFKADGEDAAGPLFTRAPVLNRFQVRQIKRDLADPGAFLGKPKLICWFLQ